MIKPKIEHDFMPVKTASRPGYFLSPEFITVHNVGVKATASLSRDIFKRNAHKYCSVHFFVDNKTIIQMLPLNEVSWHAGDGIKGRGNRESISIEICEVGQFQEEANRKAAELIRYLWTLYPYIPVVPHKYWIEKECPRLLLPKWNEFLEMVHKGA